MNKIKVFAIAFFIASTRAQGQQIPKANISIAPIGKTASAGVHSAIASLQAGQMIQLPENFPVILPGPTIPVSSTQLEEGIAVVLRPEVVHVLLEGLPTLPPKRSGDGPRNPSLGEEDDGSAGVLARKPRFPKKPLLSAAVALKTPIEKASRRSPRVARELLDALFDGGRVSAASGKELLLVP